MRTVRPMSWLPLVTLMAMSSPAWSADEAVTIKTYDLADLLRPARDYPLPPAVGGKKAAGAFNGGNGAPAEPDAKSGEEAINQYEQVIREMVAVDTWKKNGGAIGNIVIAPSNTSLIVAHTADVHRQIETLLGQLREQSSTRSMVRVRASWMVIPPNTVESLYATKAGGKPAAVGDSLSIASEDEKKVDDVLAGAELYRQAQMTCYNGQTVGIQSGEEAAYVSDLTPVVGTNAVGYDPTVDTAFSGVRLQVTPQLIPNESRVVLDLRSVVTETTFVVSAVNGAPTTQPAAEKPADGPADAGPGSANNAMAFIQRPQVADQSFNTTVRVPLGKRVIVAGMTLPDTAKGKARTLYLVVRVDAVQ